MPRFPHGCVKFTFDNCKSPRLPVDPDSRLATVALLGTRHTGRPAHALAGSSGEIDQASHHDRLREIVDAKLPARLLQHWRGTR
jgi:hypothetical protein